MKKRVLFVCWGNICRSPSAEAVFKGMLHNKGIDHHFFVDSAGTISAHNGEPADARMRQHAAKRGYVLDSISRIVKPEDFDNFDYIVAMDDKNIRDLKHFTRNASDTKKITLMTDYCTKYNTHHSVPDPYYGGSAGFELVLDLLEDACEGLLNHIQQQQ